MGDIFTLKDAVALASLFKFIAKNEDKELVDVEIENVGQAKKSANEFDEAAKKCVDCGPEGVQSLKDISIVLRKLTNEGVYDKIADINDDSGPNDVEIMDLYLGFVKPDVIKAIANEPTSNGIAFARMRRFCPQAADLYTNNIEDQNMRMNMQSNAIELCEDLRRSAVQNGAPELSEEEKKELETIAAYASITYLFFGTDLNISSYFISGVYGFKGGIYLDDRIKRLRSEIDAKRTSVPPDLEPYLNS